MSTETVGSTSRLTLVAGWMIVAIATLHIVFFTIMSGRHLPGWFAGDLWTSELMNTSIGHFWLSIGSFAVPLALLGGVVVWSARENRRLPAFVTWGIAAWVLVCALLMGPSGFPFGLIPAGMLVVAEVRRRRA